MTTMRKIALGCYAVLTLIGIAAAAYKLFTVKTTMQIAVAAVTLFMFLCVMVYVAFGYSRPHGNGLRYIMFTFAASLIFDLNYCIYLGATHFFIVAAIVMLLVAYISGRLNKIRDNKILCALVMVGLIYMWLNTSKSAHSPFNTSLSQLILWIDMCMAYAARYIEHKVSGVIADAIDEEENQNK